jgi:DHA1 family inner membrane transport protein
MSDGHRSKVGVLAFGAFAIGTDLFILAGILPHVARDLGVSVSVGGQSVTVFAVLTWLRRR